MRNFIKENFPFIFNQLKGLYHVSFIYKRKADKLKKLHEIWQQHRLTEDLIILKDIFNDDCVVHNGPFKGLKYITRSSGSAFLPKIMGSYEEPIHEWIEKCINKGYNTIIDIGCAEGYYTAGFAMRMPDVNVIAYDIDQVALKNANELAQLNKLGNIDLKAECTHGELNILCNERTLLFCDIEGSELFLLDPLRVPNLKKVDIIIESHDFFVDGVTEILIQRFLSTHKIIIAVDYPCKFNKYQTPNVLNKEKFERIVNEYRNPNTKFIFMEHFELDKNAF